MFHRKKNIPKALLQTDKGRESRVSHVYVETVYL